VSGLSNISGRKCIKALAKAGFYVKRRHHKTLDRGTLRAIIHQAGLNLDKFTDLL